MGNYQGISTLFAQSAGCFYIGLARPCNERLGSSWKCLVFFFTNEDVQRDASMYYLYDYSSMSSKYNRNVFADVGFKRISVFSLMDYGCR